jgi:hypothetical protein
VETSALQARRSFFAIYFVHCRCYIQNVHYSHKVYEYTIIALTFHKNSNGDYMDNHDFLLTNKVALALDAGQISLMRENS